MVNRRFWEDAKSVWVMAAPAKIPGAKTGSGGVISPELFKDPLDIEKSGSFGMNDGVWAGEYDEEIPFDQLNDDAVLWAVFNGEDMPGQPRQMKVSGQGKHSGQQSASAQKAPEPPKVPPRPKLDIKAFEQAMAEKTLPGFVAAAQLLMKCQLPEEMNQLYLKLAERIPVLQNASEKFEAVYQADLEPFYEYYIPEALELTEVYLEYLDNGVGEDIVKDTEQEIVDAVKKLIQAVNEKTDEIYKFASIEIKAKAKALESLMSQNGFVDSDYKL
ncbi:MAG: hypothetical protein SOZ97_14110 [Lachnospiraceae bacterium]|nr:hypothetical protein [Lachnospiraceae bacterium]